MELREITAKIDELANEIQEQDPVLAYALDRVSDDLERMAAGAEWIKELDEILKKHGVPEDKKEKIKEELMISVPGKGWTPARKIPMTAPND
jgi:DNA repair ATPase RecN